jgi:thiamine biosynthesis lipoprotein
MRSLFTFVVLCLSSSSAAGGELKRFNFVEAHMGTRFQLMFYAADEATANRAAKAAFARIAELDGIMSDYRATSELMQLCRKAGGEPVPVSPDLFAVLEKAQEAARGSDGAFDVTIGPVVRLWRLARRTQQLPERQQLALALALTGHDKVKLDPARRTVQLTKPGMQLDLGGIAKGYAADQVLLLLKKLGIDRALVAAGGDIAVSGPPPDEGGWKIGIQPLAGGDKPPSRYLLLKDAAVSTSGDTEQFAVIDGQRYSHIVDPKTGLGLLGRVSVTVVAKNGLTTDPLATAVCILGPQKGLALVEGTEGVAALFVRKTDKGEETIESKRWKALMFTREP